MRRTAVRRAAHPQCYDTRHAAHAGAAGTRLRILSRKACSCRCFAHFLHSNDTFCAFLRQNRPADDSNRILLRESMPISCHEKTEIFFKVRPNRPKQAFRYPIDTLSIPDFRRIRGHLTTHLNAFGAILDRIGPIFAPMCGFTDKGTDTTADFDPDFGARRRSGPQRGPQFAQKAGCLNPCHRPIRSRNPRSATDATGEHLPVLRWRSRDARSPRTRFPLRRRRAAKCRSFDHGPSWFIWVSLANRARPRGAIFAEDAGDRPKKSCSLSGFS